MNKTVIQYKTHQVLINKNSQTIKENSANKLDKMNGKHIKNRT